MTATLTALALGATLFTGSAPAAPKASLWEKTQDAMFAQTLTDDGGTTVGFGDEYDDMGDGYDIMGDFRLSVIPQPVERNMVTTVLVDVPDPSWLPGKIGRRILMDGRTGAYIQFRHRSKPNKYSISFVKESNTRARGTFRASWPSHWRSAAGGNFVTVVLRNQRSATVPISVR